jgi:hypothetical protein
MGYRVPKTPGIVWLTLLLTLNMSTADTKVIRIVSTANIFAMMLAGDPSSSVILVMAYAATIRPMSGIIYRLL